MLDELSNKIKVFEKVVQKFPNVAYAGHPVLRQVTKNVSIEEGSKVGIRLGDLLMNYRAEVGYGRGLAAPQIGESKSVFVTFIDNKLQIYINPKILEKSITTNFYRELCLSSGILSVDVERSEWIVMEWYDEDGIQHQQKFDDFLARLFQHEEAHLRGKLNLDEAAENGIEFALFDPLREKLRKARI